MRLTAVQGFVSMSVAHNNYPQYVLTGAWFPLRERRAGRAVSGTIYSANLPSRSLDVQPSPWRCLQVQLNWSIVVRVSGQRQVQCVAAGANQDCGWVATASCSVPNIAVTALSCTRTSYNIPNHWCNVAKATLRAVTAT